MDTFIHDCSRACLLPPLKTSSAVYTPSLTYSAGGTAGEARERTCATMQLQQRGQILPSAVQISPPIYLYSRGIQIGTNFLYIYLYTAVTWDCILYSFLSLLPACRNEFMTLIRLSCVFLINCSSTRREQTLLIKDFFLSLRSNGSFFLFFGAGISNCCFWPSASKFGRQIQLRARISRLIEFGLYRWYIQADPDHRTIYIAYAYITKRVISINKSPLM